MATSPTEQQILDNIAAMNASGSDGNGMDVVIVSTNNRSQEQFWQDRLNATKGQVAGTKATIVTVYEDWPGGAGNGLGTLYALRQAAVKSQTEHGLDLMATLRAGAAVAIYHTAGKGTRLAPLPGSENNNKPGVKLPGIVSLHNESRPITILEAVIKQTSLYASSRKGRVSVFWGDQVFIPSVAPQYQPAHHADILCRLGPMPDASEWQSKRYGNYGLIAAGENRDACQVEKIDYDTAAKLVQDRVIDVSGGVGVSLGSFSISAEMAEAFLMEFQPEIEAKQMKLDADPHFWMPLTLDENTYAQIMSQKAIAADVARSHWRRMAGFRDRFRGSNPDRRVFGAVDIGARALWWDFGQVQTYCSNLLRLTDNDFEARAMRAFFPMEARLNNSDLGTGLIVEGGSRLINCRIASGRVKSSVLTGVSAQHVEIEDSVLTRVTAPKISAKGGLLYNLTDDNEVCLPNNGVRADSFIPFAHQHKMVTVLGRDGGQDWLQALPNNPMSYDELYRHNEAVDIAQAAMFAEMEHNRVALKMFETIW